MASRAAPSRNAHTINAGGPVLFQKESADSPLVSRGTRLERKIETTHPASDTARRMGVMLARPVPDALGRRTKCATMANRISPAHIALWSTRAVRAVGVAFCGGVMRKK